MGFDKEKFMRSKIGNDAKLRDQYNHLYDDGPSGATTPITSTPQKEVKNWDFYSKNEGFEENVSLLFPDEKGGDGYSVVSWSGRMKNIANGTYQESINQMIKDFGKDSSSKAWGTLQKDAKEMMGLMTKFQLGKDDKGNVVMTKMNSEMNEVEFERFNELARSFKTNWNKAEQSLTQYWDKEGKPKSKSSSAIHYRYDQERDKLLTVKDYEKLNDDIYPGKEFVSELGSMFDEFSGYRTWFKKMGYVDPKVSNGTKELVGKWFTNTFNSMGETSKSKFESETQWHKNRSFADQVFRELMRIGKTQGVKGYSTEDFENLEKRYEASAGGTKDNPYDIRKKFTWLEKNSDTIMKITGQLSGLQSIQLYRVYDVAGVGKATQPGHDENRFASSTDSRNHDELRNSFNDYIKKHEELRSGFNELSGQAIREMKDFINSKDVKVTYGKSVDLMREDPFFHRQVLGAFFLDQTNFPRTSEEVFEYVSTTDPEQLKQDYVQKQINTYDGSIDAKTGTWNQLSPEEQTKLTKQWVESFDKIFQPTEINGQTYYREVSQVGLSETYKDFYEEYQKTFSNLDPSHLYVRSSVVAGFKHKGNYSIKQKYITFKQAKDEEENFKNQNAITILDMASDALDSDSALWNEDGKYKDGVTPSVLITKAGINQELDVSNSEAVNELELDVRQSRQQNILNYLTENKDGNEWELTYYNTTANGKYKAYKFSNHDNKNQEYTIYIKSDLAKGNSEQFAMAEYNDSDDFIFDVKGEYSLREMQGLAGHSSVHSSPRIKGLDVVNINGSKYLQYKELGNDGSYTQQTTYLGPSHSLNMSDAISRAKHLLTRYKSAKDRMESSPGSPIDQILTDTILQ